MRLFRVHCAVLNARTGTPGLSRSQRYGGHGERETPGPIPNPEAKPLSADGTAPETGWESRTPPDNHPHEGPSPHGEGPSCTPGTRPPLQDGQSPASARLPRRRPDVVGQPRVEPGQIPPGGPDLLERPALLQPVGGLPVSARVQRLVPEQVGAFAVAVEAGGHPHEPLAVDGPP